MTTDGTGEAAAGPPTGAEAAALIAGWATGTFGLALVQAVLSSGMPTTFPSAVEQLQ